MGLAITVTGAVVGLGDDYNAILLLLEQRDGMQTNTVAVRCWENKIRERAREFKPGDVVEAYGMLSSRKGKQGDRWYTSFEASGLRLVTVAAPSPPEAPMDDDVNF